MIFSSNPVCGRDFTPLQSPNQGHPFQISGFSRAANRLAPGFARRVVVAALDRTDQAQSSASWSALTFAIRDHRNRQSSRFCHRPLANKPIASSSSWFLVALYSNSRQTVAFRARKNQNYPRLLLHTLRGVVHVCLPARSGGKNSTIAASVAVSTGGGCRTKALASLSGEDLDGKPVLPNSLALA